MENNVLSIAEGVEEIAPYEFCKEKQIETVSFPSSLKRIGEGAFAEADDLRFLDLPEGLERIEARSLAGLCGVCFVPKAVSYIGKEAFGTSALILLEGEEKSMNAYRETYQSEPDYPDSYYRGPSMGGGETTITYYGYGSIVKEHVPHDDYLKYAGQAPWMEFQGLVLRKPRSNQEYVLAFEAIKGKKLTEENSYELRSFIRDSFIKNADRCFLVADESGAPGVYVDFGSGYFNSKARFQFIDPNFSQAHAEALLALYETIRPNGKEIEVFYDKPFIACLEAHGYVYARGVYRKAD